MVEQTEAIGVDARKLALEVLATLVNVKRIAADRLLRPVGISDAHVRMFLKGKDTITGDALTKRQAGALIFEEWARNGNEGAVTICEWHWLKRLIFVV